jgi:serine/threonine protein kinase
MHIHIPDSTPVRFFQSLTGERIYVLNIDNGRVRLSEDPDVHSTFKTKYGKSIYDIAIELYHRQSTTKGGFSNVFVYEDGEKYIIKRLEMRQYGNPHKYREDAYNELRNLAQFYGKPYVNQILGAEIYSNFGILVMEYVQGKTLYDWLQQTPLPDISLREQRLEEIIDAVQKIHKQGFAHLDINPRNIWIPDAKSRKAYLLDLGSMAPLGQERLSPTRTEGYSPGPFSPIPIHISSTNINMYSLDEVRKNILEPERLVKRREEQKAKVEAQKKAAAALDARRIAMASNACGGAGCARQSRHKRQLRKRRTYRKRK